MSQDTLWPLARHTKAKHELLRSYLNAWFPILGSWSGRVLFIDGFAGPGEYEGGEPGSPLVALEAARSHPRLLARCELVLVFIEKDLGRYRHLQGLITEIEAVGEIPSNVKWSVHRGSFDEVVADGLASLEGNPLAPAFVMIDPFGVKGIPYDLIERLSSYRKTELLISFMHEPIVRFISRPQFEPHLDNLFGCREWRNALDMDNTTEKSVFLHNLFRRQLISAGMTHALSFRMMDSGGRTEYFLFFATHSIKGVEAMKNAMWSVDPSGGYRFSDATDPNQIVLIQPEPDFTQLHSAIVTEFGGCTAGIGELEGFVTTKTLFRKQHLRDHVLKPLEDESLIKVTGRKKRRTYPPGCRIAFN